MRYVGVRQVVIDKDPLAGSEVVWTPTQDYVGRTVFVIGNGPSLGAVDPTLLAGRQLIAINSACVWADPIATPTDMLYFTDNAWNENRPELAAAWRGPVVTSNRWAKARLGDAVRRIDITALTMAFGCPPDAVQASSAHTAAVLAWAMGSRRVVLLGVDGRRVDGRTNWHDHYSDSDARVYVDRFLPGWRWLAPRFAELGVEVLNASADSAVDVFPLVDLSEALQRGPA